ncbi:MAG: ORF6N domain-containing protein [Bacteroidales bacterium]|nr:ORF6N domain-containing protein [Bacteroidales bacterium]
MEPLINTNNGNITVYNDLDSIKEIEDRIFCIRGVNVMIDRDLADIYGVKTKRLNEQVKRNNERFPERYMFQLSDHETLKLVANCDRLQSLKHSSSNPFAFTEQGVSMLASVLNSDTAVETSIKIIDAFVAMRHFMQNNAKIFVEINNLKQHQIETDIHLIENDRKIDKVLTLLEKNEQEDRQKLFFDGQIYDAFSLMVSIVQKAEKDIVLIDNFVNTETLDILSEKKDGVDVQIFTSKNTKLTNTAIDKFNSQYPNLNLHYTDKFHDRFIIIDHIIAYHIGASIKDAGKKCFAVSLINDKWMVEALLKRIID